MWCDRTWVTKHEVRAAVHLPSWSSRFATFAHLRDFVIQTPPCNATIPCA